ncbi:copper chaperone (plasmid) [Citricoccus sp. SGAir0253]|uniref:heavy-metal-associated domain-containing protein n=1 Tax=Citricoccus sp. SGAir0253 TaxID=2567881 RepID=UPI0010CD4B5A|nr:heavy-metal-associated domain-containing protein [Citricoccus sp. SGAir0253]QCU79714.1 copper chaperone [Citricoccus sp. SGAir0253]
MIEPTRAPLPMATSGCSCCSPAGEAAAPLGQETTGMARSPQGATTYQVEGMTCGHCVGTVADAVSGVDGVEDVRVDLVAGGASMVAVTGPAPAAAVQAAIEAAGYRVLPS